MLRPRWRKVLRDIWGGKTRTVLVVLSITVGVFAVGATLTVQSRLASEMNQNWQRTLPHSGRVSGDGFQQDFIDSVRRMPDVADAEGRAHYFGRILGKEADGSDAKFIELNGIADFNDLRMTRFEPNTSIPGNWPPPTREIVLGTVSLNLLGVNPGDTITLQTWDNRRIPLRVSSAAWTADEAGSVFAFAATGWVTMETWEWMGFGRNFSRIFYRVKDSRLEDGDHIREVGTAIEKRLKNQGYASGGVSVPDRPNQHPAATTVNGIVALMTALGIAALGLSGFLVINTVSAVLAQHVRQIGMMKAVGARNSQLSRMYCGMVMIYGALSLLFALPLGTLGARAFVNYMGVELLNLRIGTTAPPAWVLGAQFAIALVAPLIAAMAPIISGTRKTVREAISDYGISGQSKATPDTGAARPGILVSRPLALSLRNTFRRKGRLALTLTTLILAGAVFIGVMSARQGLIRTLDIAMNYWQYDFDVNLGNAYPEDSVTRAALSVPGVSRVESWGFGGLTEVLENRKDGQSISVAAPPAETEMLKPLLLRGRWLNATDSDAMVLNTDAVKRFNGADVDDIVNVKINGVQRARIKVVGVVQGVLTGPFAYMNRPGYLKLAQFGAKTNYIVVRSNTRDAQANVAIAKLLEEQFKRANIKTNGTQQMAQTRVGIMQQFDIIIYLLLSMAILLAVVGGLGLAGTMSINVIERTREIGVMRAIGASNGAIRRIVTIEGILIGAISWAIGALLAWPFSYGIVLVLSTALEFEVFHAFSAAGTAIWLAAVLGIAAAASILPAWNASRLTVREVLAYA